MPILMKWSLCRDEWAWQEFDLGLAHFFCVTCSEDDMFPLFFPSFIWIITEKKCTVFMCEKFALNRWFPLLLQKKVSLEDCGTKTAETPLNSNEKYMN